MLRAGILVVAACLIAAVSPPEQRARNHQEQAEQNVANSTETIISAPALRPIPPAKYKGPCAEPQDTNRCGLEAQWEAAKAARDAANWAKWQTILSALGVMGLLITLHLSRKATNAAVEASKEAEAALAIAERNADAMSEQVLVTRRSSERELRAYVGVETIEVRPADNNCFAAKIRFKNYGKTPAYKCALFTAAAVEAWPSVCPDNDAAEFLQQGVDLALQPSAEVFGYAGCDASGEILAIGNKAAALYVFGRVEYVDIEGQERLTQFAYRGTGDVFLRTLELQPCMTGNVTT